MKICAVICEYNPFHNGHRYQLEQIRILSGCDKLLCLMSGNFTQRGEAAIFDKFTRARHAVENGADIVLELPAAFAVAPAEIFANGAIHILSSIPAVTKLAFGCESGSKEDFLKAASAMLSEDKEFKTLLKENMKDGTSYIRARTQAVLKLNSDVDEALLTSPNNILGTEYCRAILAQKSKIEPLPIQRVGGGYADSALYKNFSSASALRAAIWDEEKKTKKLLKGNLPASVFKSLENVKRTPFQTAVMCALLANDSETVMKAPDCSEGLENRLRAMAKSNPDYDSMLEKVVSKRYTLSRLKRILAQNFLGITRKDVKSYLESPLYLKVLAVKLNEQKELFQELSKSEFPFLARKSDTGVLKREALACYETDVRANDLYNLLTKSYSNNNETLFI